jgi:L-amino acid N-acyltransferase YncA
VRSNGLESVYDLLSNTAGVDEQVGASGRRLGSSSNPLDKSDTKMPLKLPNLKAYRRLGDAKAFCRSREAAELYDIGERLELIEADPFHQSFSYRLHSEHNLLSSQRAVQDRSDINQEEIVLVTSATVEVSLRRCEAHDIAAITAIYGHAVRHGCATFELDPPDEREMASRRETLLAAGYPYIVAELGDEIVGYAYASSYRPRPAYSSTVENSVYVNEGFQGRGIGRALLERLIVEAEARNFRQMVAVIGDSANRPSVKLHESVGFQMVGTLRSVGWKHNRWLDTVLMQRALGSGDASPR